MWQFWGTLAISAFGGTFLIHYLTNFLLEEKSRFSFDWDGVVERALITFLIINSHYSLFIPVVILIKVLARLVMLGFFAPLAKVEEPGAVPQKVRLKAELALGLVVSPVFALLVGIIF
jgi:hypothetical protein